MAPTPIWITMLSIIALNGTWRILLTFLHQWKPGMAPSRENAHVQRDAAVVQPIPHITASTISGMHSPKAAPEPPTADLMITGTGWAVLMRTFRSGSRNANVMSSARPAAVFSAMVPTMAFGTCVFGFLTSSHMLILLGRANVVAGWATYEMIIPVDEVA